jgi:hypothetical protein
MNVRVMLTAFMICRTVLADVSALVAADTSVSMLNPSLTGGASTVLPISADRTVLMRFNLDAALQPSLFGTPVAIATLRLYVNHVGTAGSFDVYPAALNWNEATATFSSAVPDMSLKATFTVTREQQFVFADVTAIVQRWLDTPALNHGLLVRASGVGQLTSAFLDSRESTSTSHPAVIDIGFGKPAGPAGPAGATGPAGPQGPPGVNGQNMPRLLPWIFGEAKECNIASCFVTVSCGVPTAKVLTGGCGQIGGTEDGLNVVANGPAPDMKGWICQVVNVKGLLGSYALFQGYARCVE